MKGFFHLLIILGLLFQTNTGLAQDNYAPGTLGYLHESCKRAVQSETPDEFVGSYCARFFSGYFWGYSRSNRLMPAVKTNDPCKPDLERLLTHIEGRSCKSITKWPDYAKREPILATAHMFFGWVDYLKEKGQEDILNQQATDAFNDMIRPGPYCEIIDSFTGDLSKYPLSAAAHKFRNKPLTLKKSYETQVAQPALTQCEEDTLSPDNFRASLCGAEIMGYIAGINSAGWIQENRLPAEDPACQPGITRLYNNLDVAGYRCVPPETDPVVMALAYLKKPPQDKKPSSAAKALGLISMCPQETD